MEKGHENWYLEHRSLCRVGAMKSVVGELEKYKPIFCGHTRVRWEGVKVKKVKGKVVPVLN
jgi:hypothetical protein